MNLNQLLYIQIETSVVLFILSAFSTLIIFLLGIMGYFLRKFVEQVEALKVIVQDHHVIMSKEHLRIDAYEKNCANKHNHLNESIKNIKTKVENQASKTAELELSIAVIKNEISI